MVTQTQDVNWEVAEEVERSPSPSPDALLWGRAISSTPSYPHVELRGFEDITFGRAPACSVCIQEPAVSGIHFRISRKVSEGDGEVGVVLLEDLSTNGTYVNAKKVGKGNRVVLPHASEVMLIPQSKDGRRERISFRFYFNDCEDRERRIFGDEGSKVAENYVLGDYIGHGAFAVVYRCIHKKSCDAYAIKVCDKKKFLAHGSRREGALMDEVTILSTLKHSHIVQVFDVFETDSSLYVVLDLATGGDLFDQIVKYGAYNESDAKVVFQQLLSALSYLHRHGVVHRDLKPENILLTSKRALDVKVSDFGMSRFVGDGSFMTTICGTPQYLAPEVLANQTSSSPQGYDEKVDMWALGVVLFVMLSGTHAFNEDSDGTVLEKVRAASFSFSGKIWDSISDEAKDLISSLIVVDSEKRLSSAQAAKHKWLTSMVPSPTRKRARSQGGNQDVASR